MNGDGRLIWASLVGLAMIVFAIAGAWVGSIERRVTSVETKSLSAEERFSYWQQRLTELEREFRRR